MRLRPVLADPTSLIDPVGDAVGEQVVLVESLDVDVYRLRRSGGPDVVARVFGAEVDSATVAAAAHVLQGLADTRFPAEVCAVDAPVRELGDGVHLLLTDYVVPTPASSRGFLMAWCAALLGRLATRPGDELPPGGGWHRLGASPSDEIDAALRLGGGVGPAVAELVDTLADADDGAGLPEALIHADLTPPNAVPRGDDRPVIIDWIGAGRGPRAWPLAFLLFIAGPRLASRGLERYQRSVTLTQPELERLPGIMLARPLTLDLWSVAHGRMTAAQAVTRCRGHRSRVDAIAAALTG